MRGAGHWPGLWLWALLVAACQPSFSPSEPPADPPPAEEEIAPFHLLVELVSGIGLEELRALPAAQVVTAALPGGEGEGSVYVLGGVALALLRPIVMQPEPDDAQSGPIYLFRLLDGSDTRKGLARVAADPRVRRAEPDRIRHVASLPNDPLFRYQWNLQAISVPAAWDLSQGSENVVVAILDTGSLPHPDLVGRFQPGYDFISVPESADDGDRRRDPDPTDTGSVDTSRLHGIHVAGIIGAVTDNHRGIAGLDRRCRLMPVRVLGVRDGDGLDSDIADAVRWASGLTVGKLPPPVRPADVLNLSFGGPAISFTLQRAINEALSQGVLIVVAAGNGGVDARTYSPGGLDGVISVGAASRSGDRPSYSNHGPRVDLLAPGGDGELTSTSALDGVLSTYRDEGIPDDPAAPLYTYNELIGTSQAAPHVAGAAALARAVWPALRQRTLAALLSLSADSRYRCDRDPRGGCGAGLLNVEALLKLAASQAGCSCSANQLCLDGRTCVDAAPRQPALYAENTVRGGWCQAAGHPPPASGPWLFGLGLWAALATRRHRKPKETA